jgi:hypothetical protein
VDPEEHRLLFSRDESPPDLALHRLNLDPRNVLHIGHAYTLPLDTY